MAFAHSQMLMSATIAVTTVIITAPTPLVASTAAAVKGLSSWTDMSVKVCYLDCLTTPGVFVCACVYSTCSTYVSFTVQTYIHYTHFSESNIQHKYIRMYIHMLLLFIAC